MSGRSSIPSETSTAHDRAPSSPLDRLRAASAITIGNTVGKAVWMELWRHADADGRCFPSQARMAKHIEVDERTVRAHLQALEAVGLLRRERRHGPNGYRKSDMYFLLLPVPEAPPARTKPAYRALRPETYRALLHHLPGGPPLEETEEKKTPPTSSSSFSKKSHSKKSQRAGAPAARNRTSKRSTLSEIARDQRSHNATSVSPQETLPAECASSVDTAISACSASTTNGHPVLPGAPPARPNVFIQAAHGTSSNGVERASAAKIIEALRECPWDLIHEPCERLGLGLTDLDELGFGFGSTGYLWDGCAPDWYPDAGSSRRNPHITEAWSDRHAS